MRERDARGFDHSPQADPLLLGYLDLDLSVLPTDEQTAISRLFAIVWNNGQPLPYLVVLGWDGALEFVNLIQKCRRLQKSKGPETRA